MKDKPGMGETWQAVARKFAPSLALAMLFWLCVCAVLAAIVFAVVSLRSG